MVASGDTILDALRLRLDVVAAYTDRQFHWPDEIGDKFPALLIVPGGVTPRDFPDDHRSGSVDRRVHIFGYVFSQSAPSTELEGLQAEVLRILHTEPYDLGVGIHQINWLGTDSAASAFSVLGFNVGFSAPIGVCRMDFSLWHEINYQAGAYLGY